MKSLFSFAQDDKNLSTEIPIKSVQTDLTKSVEELETKCNDLEDSLQLMGKEFEKMEDYWQVSYAMLKS